MVSYQLFSLWFHLFDLHRSQVYYTILTKGRFLTHIDTEGASIDYEPFSGATRAYDYENNVTDHCENIRLVYQNLMHPDLQSKIRRVLMVDGCSARRPGFEYEPNGCEEEKIGSWYLYTDELWSDLHFPEYNFESIPFLDPSKSYHVDDKRTLMALYDKYSEGYKCSRRNGSADDVRLFFSSMVGFSIERFDNPADGADLFKDLFNHGEAHWIGEVLGTQNECFEDALISDVEPYWPDPRIENLFAFATNLGVPVSLHLPSVSEDLWHAFFTTPHPPNTDLTPCYQFMNIIDAAKTDQIHSSKHVLDATVHMSMGQAHYPGDNPYTWQAYSEIFDDPNSGNFLVELMRIHGPEAPTFVFEPDTVHETFANHQNDQLLDNYLHYSEHFTLCSHLYPRVDYAPEPGYEYGTPINQDMEPVQTVDSAKKLTDCFGLNEHSDFFFAVGTSATDDNKGVVVKYTHQGGLFRWDPMSPQIPPDSPPLTAITGTDKSTNEYLACDLYAGGFKWDLSGNPIPGSGKIFKLRHNDQNWEELNPGFDLLPNDIAAIKYEKNNGTFEDIYIACEDGKIARLRNLLNDNNQVIDTVWTYWEMDEEVFKSIWVGKADTVYVVGSKPGILNTVGCLFSLDAENDIWEDINIPVGSPLTGVSGIKKASGTYVFMVGDQGRIMIFESSTQTFISASSTLQENFTDIFLAHMTNIYICGESISVKRLEYYPSVNGSLPEFNLHTIQVSDPGFPDLNGIYAADMKNGQRNVWVVGQAEGSGKAQQYRGARVMFDGFRAYWETFFNYLYEYAEESP